MSKAEMLRQPKKETKGGKRKQRMFLRKALARKLKVPASSLKGKTFEELADLLDKEDLKGVLATLDKANLLLGDDEEEKEVEKDMSRGLRKQRKQIKKKVEEATGLPSDIADIISLMAEDPDIRVKKGNAKKVLNEILEDVGASEMLEIAIKEGDYTDEKGRPISRVSELTDKNISDILEDFPDLKDMIDPTIRDRTPELKELQSLRESLRGKPSVIRERQEEEKYMTKEIREMFRDEEEEEKYEKDTMQAVRMSQEDEDNLDQAEVWQYPALGVSPNANLEVPNSSLNDNMIVSANARSAFQPNPLVPVRQRYEPVRREVLEDNENMRIDPRPDIIPRQDILEQVRILEGPEGQMPHGEPHRLPNPVVVNDPRLAQNNMGAMEQNVMMNRNMMDRREMRRAMFGEGEEGKYDDAFGAMPEDDDFDELDQNEDIYNEDFEGISNRERIDEMKKIMSYKQAGRWNGNMGVGRDYARSAMIIGNVPTIDITDRMRKEELYPYKIPNRTYAGNSVNLIRNSNRSMLLQSGQLLP